MAIIKTEVKGDELVIESTKPIHESSTLKIYITVKELKKIDISGAVDLETTGKLTQEELSIDGSGASDSEAGSGCKEIGS